MEVEIVTPDAQLFQGEATLVQLPGTNGSFEIMNNHAPIIASLVAGKVKVLDKANAAKYFDIKGGVVEMTKNKIIVLAE